MLLEVAVAPPVAVITHVTVSPLVNEEVENVTPVPALLPFTFHW
jgi:hypothetical protein